MSALKTIVNDASVTDFLDKIEDSTKRDDAFALLDIFTKATGEQPKMWGTSIIGFGAYHYKSERSRQEGDWMLIGFSPRKQSLTLYLTQGFDAFPPLLGKLGKYKTSKSCLYINKLADIDTTVLYDIVKHSYQAAADQL